MNGRQAVNPFVPGRGHIPPYLAGREAEQGKLLDLSAYLQIGRGAPRAVVLSGPRGNGKTTLLRWFRREVEASGRDLRRRPRALMGCPSPKRGGRGSLPYTPGPVRELNFCYTAQAPSQPLRSAVRTGIEAAHDLQR